MRDPAAAIPQGRRSSGSCSASSACWASCCCSARTCRPGADPSRPRSRRRRTSSSRRSCCRSRSRCGSSSGSRSTTVPAARRDDRGRAADPRQHARPGHLGRRHDADRAVPRHLRHLLAARLARRARAAAARAPIRSSRRAARRCQVQVIGQQWAWTFRYPDNGGLRDDAPRAPGRPARRVPRHVAGRHPLVLGLRARRQGRRRARRRQRRLRHRAASSRRSRSAAPRCAACGTAT